MVVKTQKKENTSKKKFAISSALEKMSLSVKKFRILDVFHLLKVKIICQWKKNNIYRGNISPNKL